MLKVLQDMREGRLIDFHHISSRQEFFFFFFCLEVMELRSLSIYIYFFM